ncbi:unnamed protein product [marine sediment metagenome]|uniref:Uncharacterized protein n=1 Tax=marine sediment metagenome TaxID=412755 RepID=X1ICD2_9ZZZZ
MVEALRSIVQKKKERFQAQYRPFTTYKAPEVYCPKEKRKGPIRWCLGSFTQQRYPCPELLEATVKIAEGYAEVKCKAQKPKKNEESK